MNRNEVLEAIRTLAADRSKLRFTNHGANRDPAAGKPPVSERQVTQCLQKGLLVENPTKDIKEASGWKFTCQRTDEETVTVVAGVLVPDRMILIITAYENPVFRRRPKPTPGDDWDDESDDEE